MLSDGVVLRTIADAITMRVVFGIDTNPVRLKERSKLIICPYVERRS